MLAGSTVIAICLMAKEKLKLNLVSALTGLIIADVICWLLGALITDLAYILLFVIIGFVGALCLEIKRKKEVNEIDLLNKGIEKAKVDSIAAEYNEEKNKKPIKVRIKK
jgi:O-antigen/teichoic acid export membrane protein